MSLEALLIVLMAGTESSGRCAISAPCCTRAWSGSRRRSASTRCWRQRRCRGRTRGRRATVRSRHRVRRRALRLSGRARCGDDGLSFEVMPATRIGIVGPSGRGNPIGRGLLLRLYDPQSGPCASAATISRARSGAARARSRSCGRTPICFTAPSRTICASASRTRRRPSRGRARRQRA